MIFSDTERDYLTEHSLGRLATLSPDGSPQVQPVALWFDATAETLHLGGPALVKSRKYRNVQGDPRVSYVLDDQSEIPNALGQTGRGIEIRGIAEIVFLDPPLHPEFDHETLRIRPLRVISWNLEPVDPAASGPLAHLQGYHARDIT